MQKNWVETIAGGFVLLCAAVLLGYAYLKTKGADVTEYVLLADFDHIDGVNIGNDVRMSGIKVGKVLQQRLDPENYVAQVTIALHPGVKVPADSSVSVISESLMGGKYLSIVPGGDDAILPSGGKIEQTQSSVNLETLIGKMMFNNDDNKNKKSDKKS